MVTPDDAARPRTRSATEAGSLTVNTTLPSGASRRPVEAARARRVTIDAMLAALVVFEKRSI